jgi:PTH1 family peptidyl-tRNA hydrolase
MRSIFIGRSLFIGLGNPTSAYALHRHNVGMMAVDALHASLKAPPWQTKHHSLISKLPHGLFLVKPQTYMNRSGLAVGEMLTFYKKTPGDIVVFHDDLDLPLGKIKIKIGGGHGGHNGLRDLDRAIGPEYLRVRMGIGRPEHKTQVHDYVLSPFSSDQIATLKTMIQAIESHRIALEQTELAKLQALFGEKNSQVIHTLENPVKPAKNTT